MVMLKDPDKWSRRILWLSPPLFAFFFALMLARVDPFYQTFYSFAWWTYIPFVSALNFRRRGESLLLTRTTEFVAMIPVSAVVWFVFELFNLRLQNWYYVGVPAQQWLRWPGYLVAYGTVLPGVFETAQLLSKQSLWERQVARCPSLLASRLWLAVGVATAAAVLLWPLYFFPLVWGIFVFVLDPRLCRLGRPSLSGDALAGSWQRIRALLLGGLLCGLAWEFWNYWAGAKWIYTVPWVGHIKLFEMPVLGFFGFPPFALQCFVIYQFYRWLVEGPARSLPARVALALAALLFCATSIYLIDRFTVREWVW